MYIRARTVHIEQNQSSHFSLLSTGWTAVQRRKTPAARQTAPTAMTPAKNLKSDQRRLTLVRDATKPKAPCPVEDTHSAVNRALHKEMIQHFARIQEIRRNGKYTVTGVTIPTASARMLINYKDIVIPVARTVDIGVVDVEVNEVWKRLKVHGIPLARYMGEGTNGTERLREEIEAENASEGVAIPLAVRWLGKLSEIRERAREGKITVSSVTFVVRGEEVASKLVKNGLRIMGRLYQVELYEEARPDAMCANCCGWGHIEAQCNHRREPRCALCAAEHRTELHKCPVRDCAAARGSACIHVIASCPNCKGPHGARSSQCPKKKEAQEAAKKWM